MAADDERPPVFGSWRAWYALVLGTLAALVLALAALSAAYR